MVGQGIGYSSSYTMDNYELEKVFDEKDLRVTIDF